MEPSELLPLDVVSRPARPGVEGTRQKLVRAAAEEFAARGFQAATTREIARRAGVNEVTLFRHFRTRSELMRAAVVDALDAETELMAQHDWTDEPLRAAVARYARAYVGVVERRAALSRAIIGEGRLLPTDVQEAIVAAVRPLKEQMAAWFEQAQRRGEVRPDVDPMAAVEVLRDALQNAVLRWGVFRISGASPEVYVGTLVEIFVSGVEARALGETF